MRNVKVLPVILVAGVVSIVVAGMVIRGVAGRETYRVSAPSGVAGRHADSSERRGAWVDEVVFVRESDGAKVVNQIERGVLHLYAEGISNPLLYRRIKDSQKAGYDMSRGSSAELTFNTAGPYFASGRPNPFHNRRIREAFNWLLDRRYIADEIYGGLAEPRVVPIAGAMPDYSRLAESVRALELRYQHDPRRARAVIGSELEAMGAYRRNGRWVYDGQPIEIRILIRTEDARGQVGDYIANLLEDTGFVVQRLYRRAEEASRVWISGDPISGEWHLYTGGWVSTVINRDLAGEFDFFYTARGRPEPLWQTYEPDAEFDEIAERLSRRAYDTWEERQVLMARALELALRESNRVWLVDQSSVWARARDVGLAVDLAAGIGGSGLWPYTLRFNDRVGGRVIIGGSLFLTEPWNPVAGSNWMLDRMITRGLRDPVVLPDPFTGLFRPQRIARAEVAVREDVPVNLTLDWVSLERVSVIEVPGDAWIDWDARNGRFVEVATKYPDGITARTRISVVYEETYLQREWHDGSVASMADIVLPWILAFERADEDSALFDRAEVPSFRSFQKHFRGWRIVSEEPLTIEIYSDRIFPDAEWIVGSWAPGTTAWHVLAIGMLAEKNGELAFSSDKADRLNIEWMNLVGGPSLPALDRQLDRAMRENFLPYPEVLGRWLSAEDTSGRYRALESWRREKGHFWVGDGPFYLHSARPVEGSIVLRRFEKFADPADKWMNFSRPKLPVIEIEGPRIVETGAPMAFSVWIGHDEGRYPAESLAQVDYMLFDHSDNLVVNGEAEEIGGGFWTAAFDGETSAALEMGACALEVVVVSKLVALPAFASHAFAVVP